MRFKRLYLLIAAAFLCAGLAAIAAETAGSDEEERDPTAPVQTAGESAAPSGGTGLQRVDDASQSPQSGYNPSGGRGGSGHSAYSGSPAAAGPQTVNKGLSSKIMARASQVSVEINRTGGYRMDGRNDCYGFVRRTWDPELTSLGKKNLPVSDFVSRDWAPVTSWSALIPGDVLGTHQGHMWGPNWHGGLFHGIIGGKAYSFDNSPSNRGGAYPRVAPSGLFRYYYVPTHKLLLGQK